MKNRLAFSLALITVLFVGGLALVRSGSATFRVEKYWKEIAAAAREQGFEPSVIAAVVYTESKGNPKAVSSSGALGLMQLKMEAAADAARRLSISTPSREELFEPKTNLRCGAAYLRLLLDRFRGDIDLAIMAYFSGPGAVEREIEKNGGDAEKMKERLFQEPGSAGEYLAQVRDLKSRFQERESNR